MELDVTLPHNGLVVYFARLRIHADGHCVKVYLNDKRVANIPNADLGRADKVFIETTGFPAGEGQSHEQTPTLISGITVNAGGSELYDALVADGRVATQGIFFDTAPTGSVLSRRLGLWRDCLTRRASQAAF